MLVLYDVSLCSHVFVPLAHYFSWMRANIYMQLTLKKPNAIIAA